MRKVSRVVAVIAVAAGLLVGGSMQSASAAECRSKIDKKCTYKQLRGQVMETIKNPPVSMDR